MTRNDKQKQDRLAQALRDNLKRRKQQQQKPPRLNSRSDKTATNISKPNPLI